jgi:PTH1 family peptidyl-tRNA hydrolase
MWLIVGLGNPGNLYALNRHNIGFLAVDSLAHAYHASSWSAKHGGQMAEVRIDGQKHLLLKPQTFMNRSGESVAPAARFFKIPPEKVLVIHDELALPLNTLRVKQGGGHAGHNGLKSIDQHLGQNYWRLRLGIDHPGDKDRVTGHVLGNFSRAEQDIVTDQIGLVLQNLPLLLQGDAAGFMNRCSISTSA